MLQVVESRYPITLLPTGIFSLDRALQGGFPINRLALIVGHKKSFKTTIALMLLRNFLARCPVCRKDWGSCERCGKYKDPPLAVYVDSEHTTDIDYMQRLRVQTDRVYLYRPTYGEAAAEYAENMLRTPEVGFVIQDSNASLLSLREKETSYVDGKLRGDRAQIVARMSRALCTDVDTLDGRPKMAIMINHILENPNGQGGDIIPGGREQRYLSSTVLKLWAAGMSDSVIKLDEEEKMMRARRKGEDISELVEKELEKEGVEDASRKLRTQEFGYHILNCKTGRDNIQGRFSLYTDTDPANHIYYGDAKAEAVIMLMAQTAGCFRRDGAAKYTVICDGEETSFKSQKDVITFWREYPEHFEPIYEKIIRIPI
jgi:RecA/RadA recombinase